MKRIFLFTLGALALALSSQAADVNILDILNLTGVGGPTTPLNTNSGGGNQHQQVKGPIFSFAGDLPRIIFQRSQFNAQGDSYLQIYKGIVTQNQVPPAGSPILIGSDTASLTDPSNPPDFMLDYGLKNLR